MNQRILKIVIRKSVLIPLFFLGCGPYLHTLDYHQGPIFRERSDPGSEMNMGLAISGGGSRAAIFASGVLEALAELEDPAAEDKRSVLERVNYISSVSGGSVAASYYAMKKPPQSVKVLGQDGLTEPYKAFFIEYQTAMERNFDSEAFWRNPLSFGNKSTITSSFAKVFDREFLDHKTFSDLYQRETSGNSPVLILNGTLYNSGKRFAMSTLPSSEFNYHLEDKLHNATAKIAKERRVSKEEQEIIDRNITKFAGKILPVTFEDIQGDYTNLPLSVAVVTSASFPPVIGPVSFKVGKEPDKNGEPITYHVGDGGLFDNLGLETLTELFLHKIPPESNRRGLIIVIDASYPFDNTNDEIGKSEGGIKVLLADPTRIVGIMEQRAMAYEYIMWNIARDEGGVFPDSRQIKMVFLTHTGNSWEGYSDLPKVCQTEKVFPEGLSEEALNRSVDQRIRQIPTGFHLSDDCDKALLIKAGKKAVQNQKNKITSFLTRK